MNNIKAIILAGGKGTRMKSELPKVLHKIYDKCIIDYVCDACDNAGITNQYVIVGHKADIVEKNLKSRKNLKCILQKEQLGTGHATMQALEYIEDDDVILIINGDTPLISDYTIKSFISFLELGNYDGALASAVYDCTSGYGRIVRDDFGNLNKIVEQKDCNEEELEIDEINVGWYCFKGKYLKDALSKINNNNSQKEYYITDVPYHIINNKGRVGVYMIQDSSETQGINSRNDLSQVTNTLLKETREEHMDNGITFIDPNNTYIGLDVEIGTDTIIYPGTNIQGKTVIGKNCIIGPNTTIIDSMIGDNAIIESSKISNSIIKNFCSIGPYANIRDNSNISDKTKIGSFVETKNVNIGINTKIPHNAYLGDADIGNNVEIGCGVITSNMNTKFEKNRTTINNNAFVGCDSVLLAPMTVEEGAVVAAGTVINNIVPRNSLAIARSDLKIKKNYKKD